MRKSLLAAITVTVLAAALGLDASSAAAAGPTPPTARLAVRVTPIPSTGQWKVVLDASGSTPGSAPLTSYTFSLDGAEGGPVTQSTPVFSHVFSWAGQEGVNLLVSDADGLTDGTDQQITIGGRYQGLGPVRILDTRSAVGVGTTTPVAPGGTVSLPVTGRNGVPDTGVVAVVLNVTVDAPTAAGYLTVYPDGQARPAASSLNWAVGQTIPNLVTVSVVNGTIDLYNASPGTAHLVADLAGYYTTDPGSRLTSLGPVRILDTRSAVGVGTTTPVPAGGTVSLPVTGRNGVPDTGVTAVVLNVTVDAPTAAGYLTVYPDGDARPLASNLNWAAGQTIANLVTVPVANGTIDLYNASPGTTHLIADLAGYYGTYGSLLTPDGPVRLLDTRTGLGVPPSWETPIPPGGSTILQVGGVAGVPLNLVHGLILNVTITEPSAIGYLTVYSNGTPKPLASNLNWVAGQTIANLVVLHTADQSIEGPPAAYSASVILYNGSPGTVHVVADLLGYLSGD